MPHACTGCGQSFPDGSTEMLSGCPECNGNRFQFIPEEAVSEPDEGDDILVPDPEPVPESLEDRAQTAARSDLVDPDSLPEAKEPDTDSPTPDSDPKRDEPSDLADLREQLEDQFESIKIVDRGQYELNLMELYEREEYIIELQERGRYVIEVPEGLMDA